MPVSHAQTKVSPRCLEMLAGIADPRRRRGSPASTGGSAGSGRDNDAGGSGQLPGNGLDRGGSAPVPARSARVPPPPGLGLLPSRPAPPHCGACCSDWTPTRWMRPWAPGCAGHAACHVQGWTIALDGKDLNGSWNANGQLVLFSAMTHRRAQPARGRARPDRRTRRHHRDHPGPHPAGEDADWTSPER